MESVTTLTRYVKLTITFILLFRLTVLQSADPFSHVMTSSSGSDIPLLTNTNYVEWEFRMTAYLSEKKLVKHLVPLVLPAVHDADNDSSAMGCINRRLDPSQFYHVRGLRTATEVWNKLRAVHAKTGIQLQMPVLLRLFSHRFIDGSKIELHISTMRKDFAALQAAGMLLNEQIQGALLLSTMVTIPTWEIAISSIMAAASANKTTVEFETVAAQLMLEDQRRVSMSLQQTTMETNTAFIAGGRPPRRTTGHPGRPTCTVSGCKQPTTHSTNRCFITNGYPPNHSLHNPIEWAKKKAVRDRNLGTPAPIAAVATDRQIDEDWGEEACLVLPTEEEATALTAAATTDTLTFKVDSGATQHYVCKRDWFTSYTANPSVVTVANGAPVQVAGQGTIHCHFTAEQGRLVPIVLKDVNYVPDFKYNLLSASVMHRKANIECTMGQDCTIRNQSGAIIGIARGDCGLYRLTTHRPITAALTTSTSAALATSTKTVDADLWHRRMGHAHHKAVAKLFSATMVADADAADIARTLQEEDIPTCEACIKGKKASTPIPTSTTTRATRPLERVHMDIWGPAPIESLNGFFYFLILVDDFSRWMTLLLMRHKSDAFPLFKQYTARVENFHSAAGHRITHVRSDNGGELGFREYVGV